jgi:Resolvase, N terminal domain
MKIAAIYTRVSSEKQKDENTIASQTAALVEFAANNDFSVSVDRIIEDAGFSGATLVRPGLEKLRDLAAEGEIQAVLIHSPDRLSRKYAYQVLLTEELARPRSARDPPRSRYPWSDVQVHRLEPQRPQRSHHCGSVTKQRLGFHRGLLSRQ